MNAGQASDRLAERPPDRACPECSYLLAHEQWKYAIFVYCPRSLECKGKLVDFVRVRI